MKSNNLFKQFGLAQIPLIIALVLMALAIPVATKLSQREQDIRNRAADGIIPTPTSFSIAKGDPIFLLGKVVNESPRFSGCNNQRFSYGNNCGDSNCYGAPNYQITWNQSGTSGSVANNECWSGEPRYTFERTSNPRGDQDGEAVSVSISAGAGTRLVRWFMETTDSSGNVLSGSHQQGTFSSPGQNQTASVIVYKNGSYVWNHLWFIALDPENTPTPPTVQCPTNLQLTCGTNGTVTGSWNAVSSLPSAGGYRFYRRLASQPEVNHTGLWNGTSTSTTVSGSQCDSSYSYMVSSYSLAGVIGEWPWPGEQYCTPVLKTCLCEAPTTTTARPSLACNMNVVGPAGSIAAGATTEIRVGQSVSIVDGGTRTVGEVYIVRCSDNPDGTCGNVASEWDQHPTDRNKFPLSNNVWRADTPGVYQIVANAFESSTCDWLCTVEGNLKQNLTPGVCTGTDHWSAPIVGACTSNCNTRTIRVRANVATVTPRTATPTPARYPVCGGDCKCTTSTTPPDMSKMGNIKCSYSPVGADCCSSCDRLVRANNFTVSNTNPVPGETITLTANGISNKMPLTYRFNYYKQNATDSLATAIGSGCANWDSSKLYPVKMMSNQYWTQIGTIIPSQDMIVSGLRIPFKNDSYSPWSAHVVISDSAGLVSDNNFDSDSRPGSTDHLFNVPGNPVACSRGGQRSMLVTKSTRNIDFDFDTRPKLTKGVTYKVWAATDGYEVYAMSCWDQYKPVEIEVYKSNISTVDSGDLGKAGASNTRTWTVPFNAAIGSTYVVMVEVGDQSSISNYRLPLSTKFDYGAAAIKKTVVIRGPTPTIRR